MLEMKKKGWLFFDRTTESQIEAYKGFWRQDLLDFSQFTSSELLLTRQSKVDENYTKYYTKAWLKKVQIESSKISVPNYNREALLHLLQSYSNYTVIENGINIFIEDIRKAVKIPVLSILEETAKFLKQKAINEVGIWTVLTLYLSLLADMIELITSGGL